MKKSLAAAQRERARRGRSINTAWRLKTLYNTGAFKLEIDVPPEERFPINIGSRDNLTPDALK